MLYLVGLGLNIESISKEGLDIVKRCKKVYLENYTVNFPYSFEELRHELDKKIIQVDREFVESLKILDEASKMNVALLVYGSPLTATTHITLIQEAKNSRIKTKVIHNASIFDAVSETGLQLYKFGKVASMPKWDKSKNFVPESFMELIKENNSINAHSLILVDIGLEFEDVLRQLEISARNQDVKLEKIIVCQSLGSKYKRILYGKILEFKERKIKMPFCLIIPSKMHFLEKEFLDNFNLEKIPD